MNANCRTSLHSRLARLIRSAALTICAVVGAAPPDAGAATGSWNVTAAGNWTNGANWLSGVIPFQSGDTAYITNNIAAARTITLSSSVTNGQIFIGDANGTHIFTVGGASGQLVFDNSGAGAALTMTSTSTNTTFSVASIALNDDLAVSNLSSGFVLTMSSLISGAAGNSLSLGGGTLTLAASNTYAGGTIVNSGTLNVNNKDALGTGGLTLNSGGTAVFTLGNTVLANNITNAGTIRLGGNGDLSGTLSGNGSLYHNSSGAFTMTLLGTNSGFSGAITNAGTLKIGNKDSLGTGTLYLGDGVNSGSFGLNASMNLSGASAVSNNIVLLNDGVLGNNLSTLELAGAVSGNFLVTKGGVGTLILSGNNTYSGGTSNLAGLLTLGNANALGTGRLYMNGGALSASTDLSGGAGITNDIILGVSSGITNDSNMKLSGVISGSGGLAKLGAATLDLAGANTYTGGTAVSNGTLSVNGSILGPVGVFNGATLGGTGLIDGAISVLTGGIIAPGNSIGTLSISNNVDLDGILAIELFNGAGPQGLSDMLDVNGLFDISSGTLQLSYTGTLTNDYYIFAEYDSLAGPFASFTLPDGYTLDYQFGASNNQIALVIPEPSTFALMTVGGALALGLATRERRRRIS